MNQEEHKIPASEAGNMEQNVQQDGNDMRFRAEEADGNPASAEGMEDADNHVDVQKIQLELEDWKDKYLRLASEFDNFRKRTVREKSDLVRYANEDLLKSILPVLDDFDRSLQVLEKSDNLSAIQEGIKLIHHKFNHILSSKGLKPMESLNQPFDSDRHEAITSIPAPEEGQKGMILDEIERGYYLDEKVIRFAKVIVGA
jgi:molecular chaperone GrpE